MGDIVPAECGDRFLSMLPPWHVYERAAEYFTFTHGVEQMYTSIKYLKVFFHLLVFVYPCSGFEFFCIFNVKYITVIIYRMHTILIICSHEISLFRNPSTLLPSRSNLVISFPLFIVVEFVPAAVFLS